MSIFKAPYLNRPNPIDYPVGPSPRTLSPWRSRYGGRALEGKQFYANEETGPGRESNYLDVNAERGLGDGFAMLSDDFNA